MELYLAKIKNLIWRKKDGKNKSFYRYHKKCRYIKTKKSSFNISPPRSKAVSKAEAQRRSTFPPITCLKIANQKVFRSFKLRLTILEEVTP